MAWAGILTERLLIRRLEPADAEPMHRYRCDADVARYQSWEPKSVDELRSWIASQDDEDSDIPGTWCQLGIALRDDGKVIGDCGIHTLDDQRIVEFGITLSREFQGKGIATEAMTAVLDDLFNRRAKHRVVCSVDPRNGPSLALMRRLGMRQEGHTIKSLWFKGAWADDVIFAMLHSEWITRQHRQPAG